MISYLLVRKEYFVSRAKKVSLYIILTIFSTFINVEIYFNKEVNQQKGNELIWILVDSLAFIIILFFFIYIFIKIKPLKIVLDKKISKSIICTLVLFLLAILLNTLFLNIPTPSNQQYINTRYQYVPILTILQTNLFAPIIEELLNRGIYMNLFFQKDRIFSIFF